MDTLLASSPSPREIDGDIIFASSLPAEDPSREETTHSRDGDSEVIFASAFPGERPSWVLPRPLAESTSAAGREPAPVSAAVPVLETPVPMPPRTTFASPQPVVPAHTKAVPRPSVATEEDAVAPTATRLEAIDIDRLWDAFDAEVDADLAAARCPHCESLLSLDARESTVTCRLCGSTFATFHAWARAGNA
jgi:hypothetical protein